jgi:hypothetical protein
MAKTKRPSRSKAAQAKRAADKAAKDGTQTANDRANAANSVERPAGSGQVSGAGEERPLSDKDRLKSPEQERLENNPQGTRIDGTTARHTEPLGPPAPCQRGLPGPERRVVPQTNLGEGPAPAFNTDTDEGMAEYRASLGPVIRVAATKMGFVHNVRRRAGDVFDVREKEFSPRWMRRVDGSTPPKATTSKQALKAQNTEELANRHREVAGEKAAGRVPTPAAAPRSSGDREV